MKNDLRWVDENGIGIKECYQKWIITKPGHTEPNK